ncbi:MAG: M57 family metalloprotease [Bradymonadia bacterium]|jgi:hypothetical protein
MKKISIYTVLAAALLLPATAFSWESTMSCGSGIAECKAGVEPKSTAWTLNCVGFHLNERGTKQIPYDSVKQVYKRSLATWSAPDCSYLRLIDLGETNEDRVGFNPYTNKNANIIVFRDTAWKDSKTIMALTTVTQDSVTGKIYDADIEMNCLDNKFSADATGSSEYIDLENTLTHELGHAIGFAHSKVTDATMFGYSRAGDVEKRSLHADDIEAICTIYPASDTDEVRKCKLKSGYFHKPNFGMDERPPSDCGCSIYSETAPINKSTATFVLLLLSFLVFYSRKRVKAL